MLKDNKDSHKDCGLDAVEDSVEIDVEEQGMSFLNSTSLGLLLS